jgi:23S rRNA pseudouridine1911/1915/1917 synthase
MNRVQETIPAALAGERVDRVVALVTGLTRSDAAAAVVAGDVSVNGAVVTAKAHRLAEGDALAVAWEPSIGPALPAADAGVAFRVVHEDADVVVIDKPPGLVVHPGSGHETGTLVNGLLHRYPEIASVGEPQRPGIVHRLDKDTSGLLVVARTPDAYDGLVDQLSSHTVHRRYSALVWGHVEVATGRIEAPIGRSAREPTRMSVSERGREAVTLYSVRRRFDDPVPVTLLDCELETGRTHQIRVHLQAIGHPVVGDRQYHGERQSLAVERVFLHAAQLGFVHPRTGDDVSFDADLPTDLEAVLARLS